ncbi:nucleotidyltransferase domain-containing protein [Pyrolobus fumarii]|nr:nucleotidyltransferase domain-containing protein [Pyrolobus fumarii]
MAERLRRQDKLLMEYVKRILDNYPHARVILIGSRARGTQLPYSDFDLVVVLPRVHDKLTLIEELRRLKPRGLNLDLIVLEESELSDPIVKKMLKNSIDLHNPHNARNVDTRSS